MVDKNNNTGGTTDKQEGVNEGRRQFMKNTGIAIGGVAGGTILGGLLSNPLRMDEPQTETKETIKAEDPMEARMFFTRFEDFKVLSQATERIFPEDENGPGAIALGVPYFIDKQLAGKWGVNGSDYRQGPFGNSEDSVSSSSLNRGEAFIIGIRRLNQVSNERFNTTFDQADKEQQIEILQDFENGEVNMKGTSSNAFFALLRQSTLEGAFSDPLYGGNRDMEGWKMMEYPGPVASYMNEIEQEEFLKKDPISLTDYQPK